MHFPGSREKNFVRRKNHESEHRRKSKSSETRRMDRGTKGSADQRESFDAATRRAGTGTAAVPLAECREELCIRHTGREEAAGGSLRREKPAGDLSLHAGSGLGGGVPELFADHGPNGSDGDPPGTARRAARSG